jgi:hypothetical protein
MGIRIQAKDLPPTIGKLVASVNNRQNSHPANKYKTLVPYLPKGVYYLQPIRMQRIWTLF